MIGPCPGRPDSGTPALEVALAVADIAPHLEQRVGHDVLTARNSALAALGRRPDLLVEVDRLALIGVVVEKRIGVKAREDHLLVVPVDAARVAHHQLVQSLLVEQDSKLALELGHGVSFLSVGGQS